MKPSTTRIGARRSCETVKLKDSCSSLAPASFTRLVLRGRQGACGQLARRAHVAGEAALRIEQGGTPQHQCLRLALGVGLPDRQRIERGVALGARPQRGLVVGLEVLPQQGHAFGARPGASGRGRRAQQGEPMGGVGVPLPDVQRGGQRLRLGAAGLQFGAQLLLAAQGPQGPGHGRSGGQKAQQCQCGKQHRCHRNDCKD